MNKYKNYGLWVSIVALVPMVLKGFNINVLPDNYNEIASAILGILVAAGIISNPSIGPGYSDTVKTTNPTDITNDIKQ